MHNDIISYQQQPIDAEKANTIADMIAPLIGLKDITLSSTEMGDEEIKIIARSIVNHPHPNLVRIYLRNNRIGSEGAKAIAEIIRSSESLKNIVLTRNRIGPEGTKTIAQALKVNSSIINLHLRDNNIGDEGAEAIAEVILVNRTLEYLVLGNNNIGTRGAMAIATAIRPNPTLRRLWLDSNPLGIDGVRSIADTIVACKQLDLVALYSVLEEGYSLDNYISRLMNYRDNYVPVVDLLRLGKTPKGAALRILQRGNGDGALTEYILKFFKPRPPWMV